jgi:FlaA1/EpsC-like NDP-sugar epimerase
MNSMPQHTPTRVEELLGRAPLPESSATYQNALQGRRILVTGGGGSIGQELCRKVAECQPAKLIILDIYENNAYEIQQELIGKYGHSLALSVVIASIRDRTRIDAIFEEYRPEIVLHAAAHKHVPLMEENPAEAIKNNVFGTKNVFDAAEKYGVGKCILISTDKAVNPTSVMGASKRMCEQMLGVRRDSTTTFAAVRFGNVADSNGSVMPLFRRQIAEGGPVTVTDKHATRYFMTIAEACHLVLQASAMANGGEILVLDMGKPVNIYDLACDLIRAAGLEPEKDIKITEIGLRVGEKLTEELLTNPKSLLATKHSRIFVEHSPSLSKTTLEKGLAALSLAIAKESNADLIKKTLQEAVPTYQPK